MIARAAAGLTQEQLAGAAGVSVGTLRNWEQGHREPLASALAKLARALATTADNVLGIASGEEPAEPKHRPRGQGSKAQPCTSSARAAHEQASEPPPPAASAEPPAPTAKGKKGRKTAEPPAATTPAGEPPAPSDPPASPPPPGAAEGKPATGKGKRRKKE